MMVLSKMVLVRVHGNFGRTESRVWSQKMHLLSGMSVSKRGVRSEETLLAIYALKATAGWRVCHCSWDRTALRYRDLVCQSVRMVRRCIQHNRRGDMSQKYPPHICQAEHQSQLISLLWHEKERCQNHHCLQSHPPEDVALVHKSIQHFSS
jgi:hypothetical protein